MKRLTPLLLCALVFFCCAGFAQAQTATLTPMVVGRYRVDWTPQDGLSVSVDGIPLIRQSTFYLVKSGWTGVLFDPRALPAKIVSPQFDANAGFATITQENENAVCSYTFNVRHFEANDVLEVALTYRLKKDVPAEIEYAVGYLSGPVIAGATLTGQSNGQSLLPREIAIAPPPASNSQQQNRLCPPFTDITLATRLGALNIAYSATNALRPVLFDARSDTQEWAQDFPVFWLGVGSPSQAIRFGDGEQTLRFRFTLLPPTATPGVAPAVTGESVTRSSLLADALIPGRVERPVVIPTPKQMIVPDYTAPLRLRTTTKLTLCDDTAGTKRAAVILQNAIQEQFGLRLPIVRKAEKADKDALFIGVIGKSPLLAKAKVTVPQKPEGYGIALPYIAGRDEAGVLWAAQTAVQLLASDNSGPYLPKVTIVDWPTLPIRGVHLFHGKNALPFHQKLMDRVFSRFKLNTLVIQAEQVRWQHDPAVAPTWAGTPEQIRQEIAYARERGIKVYPLVQSYGHMEWLFNKAENRKFAEDPETPYAVNFTNPAAVNYLAGFNAEADTVFHAPAFHIGLDEVTMRGRFPYRSAPRTFPDLFVTAATYWHDFFAKRGKPVWMWADMALHPSEVAPCFGTAPSAADAAKVRMGLPKDIVMVDWQYGGHDRFPSLKKLKDAGFKKVIAATWFTPANVQNFARAAAAVGAYGALQTTWCGYESNKAVLETKERRQFVAMVLAAEYFWNGGAGPTPDKLPYDPDVVFARQWRGALTSDQRTRGGWTLHLNEIGTRPLAEFLEFGTLNRPKGLTAGTFRLGDNTVYEIAERPLILQSALIPPGDYPREVTIPTRTSPDLPAKTVRLLMTASHRTNPFTTIGSIVATFTDGTIAETPLVYGKNITAWEESAGLVDAPVLLQVATPMKQTVSLRRLEITAPVGKSIASLKLLSAGKESSPILFAATVLQ